jgi:hypothetical protein
LLVNGKPFGLVPKADISLPVGEHKLVFVRGPQSRQRHAVTIAPGKVTTITANWDAEAVHLDPSPIDEATQPSAAPSAETPPNCAVPWVIGADGKTRLRPECTQVIDSPYR